MTPDREQLRQQIADALHGAGAYCGECNFEDDSKTCPECIKVRGWYVDAVLPVLDAAVAAAVRGALEGAGRTLSAIEEDSHAAAVVQYLATPYTDAAATASPAREPVCECGCGEPAQLVNGHYIATPTRTEAPEATR